MTLFRLGDFVSHSGIPLGWKIDCDALTDEDLECLAVVGRALVGEFGTAVSVPDGGDRFTKAMRRWRAKGSGRVLIVDDVLTTGQSMERAKVAYAPRRGVVGLVIFARGPCPPWARAIFRLSEETIP